jgi:hypothetical protein
MPPLIDKLTTLFYSPKPCRVSDHPYPQLPSFSRQSPSNFPNSEVATFGLKSAHLHPRAGGHRQWDSLLAIAHGLPPHASGRDARPHQGAQARTSASSARDEGLISSGGQHPLKRPHGHPVGPA